MNQENMFSDALWMGGTGEQENSFILRGSFTVRGAKQARLRVLGLGYFHCYINGVRVSDDLFLPLNTDFEPRENYPTGEVLSGHRMYVPEYEITDLLREGANEIAIHFGGGWYTRGKEKRFGDAKAIWRVWGNGSDGAFEFTSSTADKICPGFVTEYDLTKGETQDYRVATEDALGVDTDASKWPCATPAKPPKTEYWLSDCPADSVCEVLPAIRIHRENGCSLYDCGKNISGYPVLRLSGQYGDTVRVVFSEELTDDGELEPRFMHKQQMVFICDGRERVVRPLFTWFGFRYFAVYGEAEVEAVEVIHTKVDVISAFRSDNETLNWMHDAFVNTQLTNMHGGIPSDCPHLERRGYTGDGQLVCHAAMNILDGRKFYRKWIGDILDCQDQLTGHVQYTAPYVRSGGGPGGWGCAVVEVPYQYYLHYKDEEVLRECYPKMLHYFDYLENHSFGHLVVSDKEGEWCLGDWCTYTTIVLPPPFVNNYFYVKSLCRAIEIAKLIGKEEDIPLFEKRIAERKEAMCAAYYNQKDGNFLGGMQGANAYAVDIGIGDERTYSNLVTYYRELGHYDTGIFGTDILTKVLFERGDGQLALELLLSDSEHSFERMRRMGATTIWEYWPGSLRDRSHNHPMFGAVIAYFYDYLLGIRAKGKSAGYEEIEIAPVLVNGIDRLEGFRTLRKGKVEVSYVRDGQRISFVITIPQGQSATFIYEGETHCLLAGENRFTFLLS